MARRPNDWRIDRVGRWTRVSVIVYNPRTGERETTIGGDFDLDGVQWFVRTLCRTAGLPEPWKD
jgi:hypothetical protein